MRLPIAVFTLVLIASLCPGQDAAVAAPEPYAPVHEFNPKRDASADIRAAVAEAQRTQKRIIVYVGGSWCQFCGQMGELYRKNSDLLEIREAGFITVYVYYGPGNYNRAALSGFGKVLGIPHYFVLDSDGRLLHSQHLLDLRSNGDYSAVKMKQFLTEWSPHAQTAQSPAAELAR